MAFDLLLFLQRVLGGFNIDGIEAKAVAWLEEKGAEYPDLKLRTDALAAWLQATLAEAEPKLDPSSIRDTAYGIASDMVNGTAGVDRGAWMGGA